MHDLKYQIILSMLLTYLIASVAFGQTQIDSTKIVIELTETIAQELEAMDTMTLAQFINDRSEIGQKFEGYTFKDIDSDGVSELILNVYSGGEHCCWKLIVLQQIAPDTFKSVDIFSDQYAQLVDNEVRDHVMPDYYHTCHACWRRYKYPLNPVARYLLKGDRFFLAPAIPDIDTTLFLNELLRLSEMPVPTLKKEYDQDNGERAAYASVLLSYFYLDYDIATCKRWFNQYYNSDDKLEIWDELEWMMQSPYSIWK